MLILRNSVKWRAPGKHFWRAPGKRFPSVTKASHAVDIRVKNALSFQENTPRRIVSTIVPRSNMSTRFEFSFEGKLIKASEGQSVAAALLEAGERCLRIDEAGNAKGAVCGIGVCWECRCSIDGTPDTRACVTEARPGMIVCRQHGLNPCADP
jgi:2Fe-2S iron-sulfur cluster binding domain